MKQFTDNSGRTWTIRIDLNAVREVKDALKIDLLNLVGGENLLMRLIDDYDLVADIIYTVSPNKGTISKEDFFKEMYGEALEAASTALLEELVDFFPPWKREVLRAALKEIQEMKTKMAAEALEKIKEAKNFGDKSTEQPESSELTLEN